MNTKLSMGMAAKETGVSKTTIHNAIKSGKLSAPKVDGQYQIDPSELFRVFDPVTPGGDKQGEQGNRQIDHAVTGEITALNKVIDQLEKRLEEKDERIKEYQTDKAEARNLLSHEQAKNTPRKWFWQ